jgi:2-polyprenyl-3-methyl-5-hydroxy-6-metoxy-1,4-benzoquinol methylase
MSLCLICKSRTKSYQQKVRGGEFLELNICSHCDYEFFITDPSESISNNNLDKTRLEKAGLEIPNITTDFKNGIRQSQEYVDAYLQNDGKSENALEIGCSWGYFLTLLKKRNYNPYGLEINTLRRKYVNNELKLKCFSDISEIKKSGIKFKYIFLFYILEYIPNPVEYLKQLVNLLHESGQIIIVTPNLKDGLKDIWNNRSFQTFFYDKHAINYFSPKTLENISTELKKNNNLKYSINTKQGYSIINHIGWYLNNKASTTGKVGGDYFIEELNGVIKDRNDLSNSLKTLINQFDTEYKILLEKHDYGNQIEFILQNIK